MIETALHFIETALIPLGGWGVFLASVIEEVVAPIPSAVVITLSGFVFLKGTFSLAFVSKLLFSVVIPAACGVTLGSLFVYGLAFFIGKPFLVRWGSWLGLSWNDVEILQARFDAKKIDEIALVSVRALPIVPSVAISAFYGLIRFNVYTYIVCTFVGTLVRATVLALVGWQVGAFYHVYAEKIAYIEKGILVCVISIFVCFVCYKIYKKRSM